MNESSAIGFKQGAIKKETIEDVITSNIQPRPGPNLVQITEVSFGDRVVFNVEVKSGNGDVWQAKDRKYYRRFNYKAEPMEHYEINMVRNRDIGPNLKLSFGFNDRWEQECRNDNQQEATLFVGIQNDANSVAEAALVELGVAMLSIDGYGEELLGPFSRVGKRTVRWNQPYGGTFDGVLALLDPLLRRATAIVKADYSFGWIAQVGHDETNPGK